MKALGNKPPHPVHFCSGRCKDHARFLKQALREAADWIEKEKCYYNTPSGIMCCGSCARFTELKKLLLKSAGES